MSLSGLPVRLDRVREVDPLRTPACRVPGWEGLAPVEALRVAVPPRESVPREAPVVWDVPSAVGVRPPVRMRALELEPVPRAGVRPPGCPAEAAVVVGLRTAVVVPRRIPDARPETFEEAVGVRAEVVVPRRIPDERVALFVGAGRAIPVAPPRTVPRPPEADAVGVRAAVVVPRAMPAERAEGVGAAPAARTADGREAGVCTGRAIRAAW